VSPTGQPPPVTAGKASGAPGLPLGPELDWTAARMPGPVRLRGRYVALGPVDPARDAGPLYIASHPPYGDEALWTYLSDGPYSGVLELAQMLRRAEQDEHRTYFAITPLHTGEAAGLACYLRAKPEMGSIEIGHVWFGLELRRTRAATEAIYLLAEHAFEALGYRRLEWKCDALNAASRRAAARFGFVYEGTFRAHQVVKGRNRDTAWFALTREDWAAARQGIERWLAPGNFDKRGAQRRTLADCRGARPAAAGPPTG
jgi:RimJ/RimL family protein N-acetyltransferase